MSYQTDAVKKTHTGKELVSLSVAKEILDIRDDIEKNVQHAGPAWELVFQAYSEIQKAHGHAPSNYTSSCSGCTVIMNTLIKNWLKLYDRGSVVQKARSGAVKSKPLVAVKDKKTAPKVAKDLSNKGEGVSKISTLNYAEMSYGELLTVFESKASKEEKDKINGGNKPKKGQLLKYFGE